MLEIQNVSKTFNAGTVNQKMALNGLNLKLNEGDFVTVIGGNGAGKSTMLNAVAGVWPVDEGKILIDGVDVTRLSEHQRAAYIGRVFQDPMTGTAATMQIEENLALAARRGKRRGLRIGITKAERERYRELLKSLDLGLEDRLTARVGLLSGGQRQRVYLAMALAQDAPTLFLDEPTAFLDVSHQLEVGRLAGQLARQGKAVELTPREFDLLEQLMRNRGAALYRDVLYGRVWGGDLLDSRTLDLHIQRLRKKLGWADKIETVYRVGYRLKSDQK